MTTSSSDSQSLQNVGQLSSFQLTLTNRYAPDTIVDVTGMLIELDFVEDVFSDCIYGTCLLQDAVDLLGGSTGQVKFPGLIGEEVMTLSFTVPGRDQVQMQFDVVSVGLVAGDRKGRSRTYAVGFASREVLIDASTLVQKSYRGPISDTANSVFNDFLAKPVSQLKVKSKAKTITVEPTMGPQTLVIPRLSPFETMEFLRRRAVSASSDKPSGSYLFFETRKGYNFCDVEYLVQQGANNFSSSSTVSLGGQTVTKDQMYTFEYSTQPLGVDQTFLVDQFSRKQYRTCLTMEQVRRFDVVSRLRRGVLASGVDVLDLVNGYERVKDFDFSKRKPILTGAYDEFSQSFVDEFKGKYTRHYVVPKDTSPSFPDSYLDSTIPSRSSYMARLDQDLVVVTAAGDPGIYAGDVIKLNVVRHATFTDDAQLDRRISGKFLIGTIRHRLNTQSYFVQYDLYKTGYEEQLK